MRSNRLLLCLALVLVPRVVSGQEAHAHAVSVAKAAPTEAEVIFSALKSLNGTWIGAMATVPAMPKESYATIGDSMRVTLRVLSRGHTVVHEMHGAAMPEDPGKYDHPVTVIYLNDDGKLTLTHYCDAGNRPRMTARVSPDGKTIDFDFVDVSGRYDRTGHMHHATFTLVDADHHVEDWTYMMPNNKTARAHLELHRQGSAGVVSGR